METTAGIKLSELPDKFNKSLTVIEGLEVAENLLTELSHLHGLNPPVIHDAVRPQNLLLSVNGKMKLTAAGKNFDHWDQSYLNYLPLEQIWKDLDSLSQQVILRGCEDNSAEILLQPPDVRCNLYSLGATLYKLMTGAAPPDAMTRVISIIENSVDPLVPAHIANPRIKREFSAILSTAMQIMRENRFNSAKEMRQAIGRVRAKLDPTNPVAVKSGKKVIPSKDNGESSNSTASLEERFQRIRSQKKDLGGMVSKNLRLIADQSNQKMLSEIPDSEISRNLQIKPIINSVSIAENAKAEKSSPIEKDPIEFEKPFVNPSETADDIPLLEIPPTNVSTAEPNPVNTADSEIILKEPEKEIFTNEKTAEETELVLIHDTGNASEKFSETFAKVEDTNSPIFSAAGQPEKSFPRFAAAAAAGILILAAAVFSVWFMTKSAASAANSVREMPINEIAKPVEQSAPATVNPPVTASAENAASADTLSEEVSKPTEAAVLPTVQKVESKPKAQSSAAEKSNNPASITGVSPQSDRVKPTAKPAAESLAKQKKQVTVDDIINDN